MGVFRVRFLGGASADQWTTDDLKRHFGTKKGQVPRVEWIDVFSDTVARIVVVQIDPKRRVIRHANDTPNLTILPTFDRPEYGQYAKFFDTALETQRIDVDDEIKESFAIVCNGACVIDLTIKFENVPGQFVKLLDAERMADRKRMDRQDSLTDATDPGFRMGSQFKIMGDNDPRI